MVPSEFSARKIEAVRKHLIMRLKATRLRNGRAPGNVYLYYRDIADLLGYEIECESDGDRIGIVLANASRVEFPSSQLIIASIVVSVDFRRPGIGFYDLAEELGLFQIPGGRRANPDGAAELAFWNSQVTALVLEYGS